MLPYEIAFIDDDNAMQGSAIDIIFNVLLGIDIILNFFSAYLDNEENVVKNRRVNLNLNIYFVSVFLKTNPTITEKERKRILILIKKNKRV